MSSRPVKETKIILDFLQSHDLGMDRKSVAIQPYSNKWAEAFVWLKEHLTGQLSDGFQCEHVGSTSIPGIKAKPALDVLCVFDSEDLIQKVIPEFKALGFIYKGDGVSKLHGTKAEKGRHFFSFYNLEETTDYVHLHVFAKSHSEHLNQIIFRDHLLQSPKLIKEYESLKEKFQSNSSTRHEYTRKKQDFIFKVLGME